MTLLDDRDGIPQFIGWIIGGDTDEAAFLNAWISRSPRFSALLRRGRLFIWEHVAPDSLPELYSRALVTVIPSSFEQFGLVATEAMACGCPVVAAAVGGLNDTVVPTVTGRLCTPESPLALASAMATYLRNPRFSAYEGANGAPWANSQFDADRTYAGVTRLLSGEQSQPPSPAPQRYRASRRDVILAAVSDLLGVPVHLEADVSGESQISLRVGHGRCSLHVKVFGGRPQSESVYLTLPEMVLAADRAAVLLARHAALVHDSVTPRLLALCERRGLFVTEWVEAALPETPPGPEALAPVIAALCRTGRALKDPGATADWREALGRFLAAPNADTLAAFDLAASRLQAPLTGGHATFVETHPLAEAWRYRMVLDAPPVPVPTDTAARLKDVLDGILAMTEPVIGEPELSHGSSEPKHILRHGDAPLICDLERLAFRQGPYDQAHWVWKTDIRRDGARFPTLVPRAETLFENEEDRRQFALWCVVIQISAAFGAAMRGSLAEWARTEQMIDDVHEVLYRLFPIR